MPVSTNPAVTGVDQAIEALSAAGGDLDTGYIEAVTGLGAVPIIFDIRTTKTLPTGMSVSRADSATVATVRDSNGKLQLVPANTARFNHTPAGVSLGLLIEGSRQNKNTNTNINPAATTNVTGSGDASGVISLVDDSAALASAGLDAICSNGMVFDCDNTAGATNFVVTLGGTPGNTNNHSFSAYARMVTGASASMSLTSSAGSVTISGTGYARWESNNVTVDNSGRQVRFIVPAGRRMRFILNQLEEGAHSSSVIKIAGAAATRALELPQDTAITTRAHYKAEQGAIIAEFTFDDILTNAADSQILLTAGTGLTYTLGIGRAAGATRSKTFSRGYVNSVNQFSGDLAGVDAKQQRYPVAVSWRDGLLFTASAAAATYQTVTPSGPWSGIDRLYIGSRAFTETVFGHLLSLTFYKAYRTPVQLGRDMVKLGDLVVHTCGQSNMTGWFQAQSGSNNAGQRTAKATVDSFWTATRNFIANGGTAGTSVRYYSGTSDDTNYWLNTDTGELGAPFRRFLDIAQGCSRGTVKALIDTSGESDAGACTKQQFKDAQIAKFNLMRSVIGNVPVFLVPIGRNTSLADGYQTIREAQWELAQENPSWIYLCPERFDLALSDSIHMTDAANGICAERATRKMLKTLGEAVSGGVDGPQITNVNRSGTTVTVTLAHDGGTDFTPTSAISGFQYFNGADYNATANAITAAVRTNATTITLTLTTDSAGTLYYGKGSLSVATIANLVKDNSAQALPLRSSKWAVA